MNNLLLYNDTLISKTNIVIPVFSSGKAMFSKYSPEKDAINYVNQLNLNEPSCVLVGGIGNGIHISELLSKKNISKVIALEYDNNSLEFCKINFTLPNNKQIIYTTIENLSDTLKNNYIPSLDGSFIYHPLRTWSDEILDNKNFLFELISTTLNDIGRDYATQQYFGKLWFRNILLNLQFISKKQQQKNKIISQIRNNNDKTAAIVGAGPSLDSSISKLQKYRELYFIISTDTGLSSLFNRNIIPDLIVTIDSQNISTKHFIGHNIKGIPVLADISSSPSIIKYCFDLSNSVIFLSSGHPLTTLINNFNKEINKTKNDLFVFLSSGGGTVLQTALDFAVKNNFQNIELFGADFSFTNNKPYAKGTYLDKLYLSKSNKINSLEKQFSHLMYRTKTIINDKNILTTETMKSYKESLLHYISIHNTNIYFSFDNILPSKSQKKVVFNLNDDDKCFKFDYNLFIDWFTNELNSNSSKVLFSLLPFKAWLNNTKKNADIYSESKKFCDKIGVTHEI